MSILNRKETVRNTNDLATFLREFALFPPVNIDSPLYAEKHVVVHEGDLCGFGMLKLVAEAILVLDPRVPSFTRAKTVEELVRTAIYKGQLRGLDEIHAFLTGPDAVSLAKLLRRHFGFEDIIGIPLVKRLNYGKRPDAVIDKHDKSEL